MTTTLPTRTEIRKLTKPALIDFARSHSLLEHLSDVELDTMNKPALLAEVFGTFDRIDVENDRTALATDTVAKSLDETLGFDEPAKKAPKSKKATATAKIAKPEGFKTWTTSAAELREGVALARTALGDDAAGWKAELGARHEAKYATTKTEAAKKDSGAIVEYHSIELGSKLDEARMPGYVAHVLFSGRGKAGAMLASATIWLSDKGPIVITTADLRK